MSNVWLLGIDQSFYPEIEVFEGDDAEKRAREEYERTLEYYGDEHWETIRVFLAEVRDDREIKQEEFS